MSDTTPRDQLAALLADDWNPDRDPILTAMFRDYAQTIIAAGWRPPARTVTTVEERAAVRRGTVVRSASGTIACRHDKWNAVALGVGAPFDWTVLALPLTVIYEPEEGE